MDLLVLCDWLMGQGLVGVRYLQRAGKPSGPGNPARGRDLISSPHDQKGGLATGTHIFSPSPLKDWCKSIACQQGEAAGRPSRG